MKSQNKDNTAIPQNANLEKENFVFLFRFKIEERFFSFIFNKVIILNLPVCAGCV